MTGALLTDTEPKTTLGVIVLCARNAGKDASGCFLGKGLGRSSLRRDCCEIVPQLPGTQSGSRDLPTSPIP